MSEGATAACQRKCQAGRGEKRRRSTPRPKGLGANVLALALQFEMALVLLTHDSHEQAPQALLRL